jgi:glycine cleavage system aminomethyltransferase T
VRALRVSYVGELGWELYVSPEYGARLWDLLWEAGRYVGLIAAGRAAFDTLRLEKGYRLWGVDMDTEHRPRQAGVAFAVKLGKGPFRGREALLGDDPPGARWLRCLRFDDPAAVAMGKEPVLHQGGVVGYVTSAGLGYSTGESLAYAWVSAEAAETNTAVAVEHFGQELTARIVAEPRWDPQGLRLRL